MAPGGSNKRRVADHKPASNQRQKFLGVDKKFIAKTKPNAKPKSVSLKNQIRSTERMLRKDLPIEVKEAQVKKLEALKKQNDLQDRLAVERKILSRNKKRRFFERRKIDRKIAHLEKQQQSSTNPDQEAEIAKQIADLKEDLEYVRFFPKTEKYMPLFMGVENLEIIEKRNKLRKQIKDNIVSAAASGKDLEETGNEDDGLVDADEDDFFLDGTSSDEENADDKFSDKKSSEPSYKTFDIAPKFGMPSDDKNQRPSSRSKEAFGSRNDKTRNWSKKPFEQRPEKSIHSFNNTSMRRGSFSKKPFVQRTENSIHSNTSSKKPFVHKAEVSTFSNTSNSGKRGPADFQTGNNDNLSFNSDVHKPKRKRRPKKKKQQE